jgi:hypothetical protein
MSLKSRLFAAFAVLSMIVVACATSQQNQPTQEGGSSTVEELPTEENPGGQRTPTEATPAPTAGHQLNTFGGDEEGFTAKMPGTPQVARGKVPTKAGDIFTAAWNGNVDGVIYSLSLADYPAKVVAARPAEAFLNEGRDGIVGQVKGKLVSEENITINDTYPGKSFTVSSDNGEVKARNYLVGPRLYTMLTLYNPSIGAPSADEFLRSLTLINPPPRIERKSSGASSAGADGGTPGPSDAGTK